MVHVRDSGGLAKSLLTSGQLFIMWPHAGHSPLHLWNASLFLEPSHFSAIILGVSKSQSIVRAFSSGTFHPLKVGSFWPPFLSLGLRHSGGRKHVISVSLVSAQGLWVLRVLFDDITTRWQHGSVSRRSSPTRSVLYGYWALGMWLVIIKIVFHVKHTWEFEDLVWKKNNLSH